ncbi:sugar O-acyltransferase, sialic acid O-acetyltransferase NeuD family [Janthinobacterium sp. TND4EL3]|nr:sugar O-acyltransferase, sialic acid O-acetyltransferase NeuD family [Janthinobacterium sp. TND4EL3]
MNIVIIGSSGHAKVVIDVIERQGKHHIVGLIDAFRTHGEETMGYRVLGAETDLPVLAEQHALGGVLVAIGDNHVRARVTAGVGALCPDLCFITAVHPQASVARGVRIGAGSVLMAGAVVNPGCEMGPGCIVNTRASLDHDSVMDAFSSLAPAAATGGNCHLGSCSALGMGGLLLQRLRIGAHSVVGAGAVVTRSVPDMCVSYGAPARVIRSRVAGDKYL